MKKLFFDIEVTGHHSEYINHLVDYIVKYKPDDKFFFVVNPEFYTLFPDIIKKSELSPNINFTEVLNDEYKLLNTRNIVFYQFKLYQLMDKYAIKTKAQIVYLMTLNYYQLPLIFNRPSYQIRGILFKPFYRMDKELIKNKLKYYRKIWQTWFLLSNKKINRIFILNDKKTTIFFNQKFRTKIFDVLPDPIPIIKPTPNFSVRRNFKINSSRKIFLLFGSLSERKGVFEVLDSFNYLDKEEITNISLLLIGKANNETEQLIRHNISIIIKKHSESQLIFINEFITESTMKSYFDQCDFVLLPYKNIESSSGVLGHAVAAGKPVIATNKGLIGNLVLKNNLGILLDDINPVEIASKMKLAISKPNCKVNNQSYIESHKPASFAYILLKQ